MKLTRREMLLAGAGLMLAGCAQQSGVMTARPHTDWPASVSRPSTASRGVFTQTPPQPTTTPTNRLPLTAPPSAQGTARASTAVAEALHALPRSSWASKPPISARILPMNGVNRITCHHEGWTPVWFSDPLNTRERMETIRASHINRMSAGDIGYHFVIDRAGRLWEGRPLTYQGAHVKNQNEHNIGIMMLGNFDQQSPSTAQLSTLQSTLCSLRQQFRVPVGRIFTHQELNPTACPGLNLQPRIASMRSNGMLG